MPLNPPPEKVLAVGRARLAAQLEAGRSPETVFLHIPKTGGSSVDAALTRIAKAGGRPPVRFPHMVGLEAAETLCPGARFALILRDPLERIVSAFNSRLRQGRPRAEIVWRPAEAPAFAHYRSADRFLRGLLSDDPFDMSMAAYAFAHIGHLKRGYAHYFGDAEAAAARADRFALIGELTEMERFYERLLTLSGAAQDLLPALSPAVHQAPPTQANALAKLTPEEQAKLRARFASEYAIYDQLRRIAAKA